MPGGAPAKYTPSVKAPLVGASHGSTLPGAPTTATVVPRGKFVPFAEDEVESDPVSLPPRATPTRRSVDKAPLPQPRLSVRAHSDARSPDEENNEQEPTQADDIDLTTVTEISDHESPNQSINQTLSPSPRRCASKSSIDGSITDMASPALANSSVARSQRSGDEVSLTSSVDTPLKNGQGLAGKLDLSLDTPVKEALKARVSVDT